MEIKARIPGTIVAINVKPGDTVKARDNLGTMEAMKMEQPIPCQGRTGLRRRQGQVRRRALHHRVSQPAARADSLGAPVVSGSAERGENI